MVLTKVPEPATHIIKAADTKGHSSAGYSVSHSKAGRITITGKDTDNTLTGKVRLFLLIAVVVLVFAIILTPTAHAEHNFELYQRPSSGLLNHPTTMVRMRAKRLLRDLDSIIQSARDEDEEREAQRDL